MADNNKSLLQDPAVKWAAIGVGLLVVGKALGAIDGILETLGIKDSQETKDLDQANNNPGSFWSPTFWQNAPAGSLILKDAEAVNACQVIYDAFGAFNDNEEQAIAVFKALKTQSQASYLAYIFNRQYQQDLLTFLRGGSWPQDRLSDTDVYNVTSFIQSLPKYK